MDRPRNHTRAWRGHLCVLHWQGQAGPWGSTAHAGGVGCQGDSRESPALPSSSSWDPRTAWLKTAQESPVCVAPPRSGILGHTPPFRLDTPPWVAVGPGAGTAGPGPTPLLSTTLLVRPVGSTCARGSVCGPSEAEWRNKPGHVWGTCGPRASRHRRETSGGACRRCGSPRAAVEGRKPVRKGCTMLPTLGRPEEAAPWRRRVDGAQRTSRATSDSA